MAKSYLAQHLEETGDFKFEIARETATIDYFEYHFDIPNEFAILYKVKLQSRHMNAVKYFTYVLIDSRKEGVNAIAGHTCSCKCGLRVVGCCSHVATIIWYFGYAKYLEQIPHPARHLSYLFDEEEEIESDDED